MKKLKIYTIIRTVKETYCVEAKSYTEAKKMMEGPSSVIVKSERLIKIDGR